MDFDGAKDITLEPTMEIKLLEAKFTQDFMVTEFEDHIPSSLPALDYIPGSLTFPMPDPISKPITLSSEERILKYLAKGTETINGNQVVTPVLSFEFTNTIDREFEFEISLLDKDNNVLTDKQKNGNIIIEASSAGVPRQYFLYSYSPEQIKSATDVVVDFTIKSGADLYKGTERELSIRATGVFNFKYDVSDGLP